MNRYMVIANVRKRGAVGSFYNERFLIETAIRLSQPVALDLWQAAYSSKWELNCIYSLSEIGYADNPEATGINGGTVEQRFEPVTSRIETRRYR